MLAEIKGTRLPNPPWHKFAVDEVLDYYNGPRLLLQRSDAGQWYLAWWSDSDAELDRWIYLPLSVDRMAAVLSGQVEYLDALRRPEGGATAGGRYSSRYRCGGANRHYQRRCHTGGRQAPARSPAQNRPAAGGVSRMG